MKRWALLCGAMLLFAGIASAQETPKVEVFGGYPFARLSAQGFGVNFNGGSASVSYNPNNWLGLVADFGGYHGGVDFGNANVYTYLFGPKVAFRRNSVTPFVQTLFGGAHATAGSGDVSGSANSFAMTLGGGLDWNATPHIGVRLVQAEYFMTRFASTTENGTRISAGVVFRW